MNSFIFTAQLKHLIRDADEVYVDGYEVEIFVSRPDGTWRLDDANDQTHLFADQPVHVEDGWCQARDMGGDLRDLMFKVTRAIQSHDIRHAD